MTKTNRILLTVVIALLLGIAVVVTLLIARGTNGSNPSGFTVSDEQRDQWAAELEANPTFNETYRTACGKADYYRPLATLAKTEKQRLYYQFKVDAYEQECTR